MLDTKSAAPNGSPKKNSAMEVMTTDPACNPSAAPTRDSGIRMYVPTASMRDPYCSTIRPENKTPMMAPAAKTVAMTPMSAIDTSSMSRTSGPRLVQLALRIPRPKNIKNTVTNHTDGRYGRAVFTIGSLYQRECLRVLRGANPLAVGFQHPHFGFNQGREKVGGQRLVDGHMEGTGGAHETLQFAL